MDEQLSVRLPPIRITPTMKDELDNVIKRSITPSMATHLRHAIRLYISQATSPVGTSHLVKDSTEDANEN